MHYGCDGTYKYTLQPDWSREERELQVHYFAGTQPSHAFPFFIVKNASRYSNSYCPFSRLPLASYEDRAAFKIFVLDVGLLGAMSNLKATTIVSVSSYGSSSNPLLSLAAWFLSQIHSVVSGVPTTMASFTS